MYRQIRFSTVFLGLILALSLAACGDDSPKSTPVAPQGSSEVSPMQTQDPLAGTIIKGKILETLPAGGYSYLHLDMGGEKTWVAIPASNIAVGEEVSLKYSMTMMNFPSKSLDRTFEKLIFASGFADGTQPPSSHPGGASPGWGSASGGNDTAAGSFGDALKAEGSFPSSGDTGSNKAVVPFSELKVDKAAAQNAYTVGEVFSQGESLHEKKVSIKGKVVKVSPNIMGKNWIHLQDGSGDPSTNTHDLVVTSADIPNVGEVITIEGVVASNKDFGAGYQYKVIVEEAAVNR
ncbi:DNA-binding protein [Thermodesulfobacteriota bacterium]